MEGHSNYKPERPALKWLEERLPIVGLLHSALVSFPTPKNINYLWTFGGIAIAFLAIQIVTGIVLAMHYTPNVGYAFNSVEHIMRDVNYGWLLRYVHANGASFFFIAVYIHVFRGLYYGSYKEPRELLWILGMIMFFLMMATAFMGYVLPWGQMSFWAAAVITGLFKAIPVVGESLQTLLLGGFSVGNPTLNRFFSLHYLLPFMIVAVLILHIWAVHVTGQNNPSGIEVKDIRKETLPFTPYATIKDILALVVFLIVFAYTVIYAPDYLGHADNYIPADPLVTPAHIVPDWYFLPFYAILRAITFDVGPISAQLGGVLAMFGSIAVFIFLPWLDTSKVRSAVYRPAFKVFVWLFVVNAIFLGWLGAQPAEGTYIALAQVSTAYYFGFFLIIMPVLGLIEKPLPQPASLEAAIAAKKRPAMSTLADD